MENIIKNIIKEMNTEKLGLSVDELSAIYRTMICDTSMFTDQIHNFLVEINIRHCNAIVVNKIIDFSINIEKKYFNKMQELLKEAEEISLYKRERFIQKIYIDKGYDDNNCWIQGFKGYYIYNPSTKTVKEIYWNELPEFEYAPGSRKFNEFWDDENGLIRAYIII